MAMLMLRETKIPAMMLLARFVCATCGLWMLIYCLIGGTSTGKAFYSTIMLFTKDKAGTPLVALVIPTLLAGTVASLFSIRRPESSYDDDTIIGSHTTYPRLRNIPGSACHASTGVLGRCRLSGDPDFKAWGIAGILIPCAIFTACNIYRNVIVEADDTTTTTSVSNNVADVANAFGITALVALAVQLVPVARHGSLLVMWGLNVPAAAVQLHVIAGRCVMGAVLLHASFHVARWSLLLHEDLLSLFVLFPAGCLHTAAAAAAAAAGGGEQTYNNTPVCRNAETDCSCYAHVRNVMGLTAALSLLVIAVSSLHVVRRRWYAVFYKIHVLAGPTLLLFTVLHWNRSIMYLAGGLLYYVACSFPVLIEQWSKRSSVRLVSIERIMAGSQQQQQQQRPCMAITFAASDVAMTRYRAGQYVKVKVPSISAISHPFTINTVPSQPRQLRIVVRCTGPFTSSLADQLTAAVNEQQQSCNDDSDFHVPANDSLMALLVPAIYLDGFHGCPHRVEQVLQHDVVVIVSGGIGITPYLSLLHKVHQIAAISDCIINTRKVILHWTCRDPSLVAYVKREYLDPLLRESRPSSTFQLQIVIHRTGIIDGRDEAAHQMASYSNLKNPRECGGQEEEATAMTLDADCQQGVPFAPCRYSPGSKSSYKGNVASFLSFAVIAWGGLACIWYAYFNWQSKTTTLPRLLAPIVVVLLGAVVSLAVHRLFAQSPFGRHFGGGEDADVPEPSARWLRIKPDEEDETESTLELGDICGGEAAFPFGPTKAVASCSARKSDTVDALDEGEATVQLEERKGRPTVHQFLNCLDDARCPGLFACGPVALLNDIRSATKERCLLRFQQCIQGHPNIELYEEIFEM